MWYNIYNWYVELMILCTADIDIPDKFVYSRKNYLSKSVPSIIIESYDCTNALFGSQKWFRLIANVLRRKS